MGNAAAILMIIGVALSFAGLFAYTYGYDTSVCPNSVIRGDESRPCQNPDIIYVKPYSAGAPLVVIVGVVLIGISVRLFSSW